MVAGYADDAIKLSQIAMNQPDRNGSYSADEAQKDAYAALVNMHASRIQLEIEKENSIGLSWAEIAAQRAKQLGLRLQAWRAERRAASLFADFEVLQSRVRPYAPLDVHIPEWLEPELVAVIGTGITTEVLDQALENGAFQLNDSYYQSYKAEILYLNKNFEAAATAAISAIAGLPEQEVLLRRAFQRAWGIALADGRFFRGKSLLRLSTPNGPKRHAKASDQPARRHCV